MFNNGDIIEYIDCTWDTHMNSAIDWCQDNNATLDELIDRRVEKEGKLFRYFIINQAEEVAETPIEDEVVQPDPIQERIAILKDYLAEWDYKTSKYADGEYTEEEWSEIVAQRKAWRTEINELEAQLNKE